ncbi:MAG: O-antigen ligase family protein [Armatimonadota bacterium]
MLSGTDLNVRNKLLTGLLLIVAIASAVTLVLLGQSGVGMVVFVSVAVVVTVASLYSGEFGLMALIFVAAVDGFLKGISPGWHTQLLKDYLIAILLLRWAWMMLMGHRPKSLSTGPALPIALFAGWTAVQLFNARLGSVILGLAGFRTWLLWVPVFFIAHDMLRSRRQIEHMVLFIVFLLLPVSVYGIIQYQVGLDHLYRLGSGFDVYRSAHYAGSGGLELRPPSTAVTPHTFAGLAVMGLFLTTGLVGYFSRRRILQLVLVASIPIMSTAILITAVRNAAASAVIGGIAILVIIRRVDLALIVAALGILAFLQVDVMTADEATTRVRSVVDNLDYTVGRIMGPWQSGLRSAIETPLGRGIASGVGLGRVALEQGYGPENMAPETRFNWIENEYGRALRELGMPGFIFFVWMLYAVLRGNLRAYHSAVTRRDSWLLAGLFGACSTVLARLLVGSALYGPAGSLFWLFGAMALRISEVEQDEIVSHHSSSAEARATVLGAAELPWQRRAGQ